MGKNAVDKDKRGENGYREWSKKKKTTCIRSCGKKDAAAFVPHKSQCDSEKNFLTWGLLVLRRQQNKSKKEFYYPSNIIQNLYLWFSKFKITLFDQIIFEIFEICWNVRMYRMSHTSFENFLKNLEFSFL